MTGRGNRVDDLAARLAAAEATIASLQVQNTFFKTFLGHKIIRVTNAGNPNFNGHYFMFGFQDTDCRWEDNREAFNLCPCIDCPSSC